MALTILNFIIAFNSNVTHYLSHTISHGSNKLSLNYKQIKANPKGSIVQSLAEGSPRLASMGEGNAMFLHS